MFVFPLPVSLIAFSKLINNEPGPYYFFSFCLFIHLFIFLLSLYRNQRDLQESLPLNVFNVGARLEFASENGTGIQRFHSEPLVQQEGVYTELIPESVMVIILTMNLKLPNMSLIKEGTIACALLPFFKLFSSSSRCLLSALPFPCAYMLLLWRTLTVVFWQKNFPYYISLIVLSIYHYYSSNFIHPFISLLSLIYIF